MERELFMAELQKPSVDIPRVPWEVFDKWLAKNLEGGEHISIFASTGDGKTHLIRHGLLPHFQRDPVLILDVKRDRGTLSGIGKIIQGFPTWDQRLKYRIRKHNSNKWKRDPEWYRLQPPMYRWSEQPRQENREWRKARNAVGTAVDKVMHEGGWCLVADDVALITDTRQPSLNLAAPMRNVWKMGRDRPVTLIAATQQPAGAPSEMYDQPTHLFLGGSEDERRHERLAEIGGNRKLLTETVNTLQEKEFLYVHGRKTNGRRIMAIVIAPSAA